MAEKKKPRRDTAPGDKHEQRRSSLPEPKPKKRAISENPAASLALVRRARPARRS